MVMIRAILGPLAAAVSNRHAPRRGHAPPSGHTLNVGLFPNAEVVDFWARYQGDRWLDHEGDGYRVSGRAPKS
jgi:hypothetical protein